MRTTEGRRALASVGAARSHRQCQPAPEGLLESTWLGKSSGHPLPGEPWPDGRVEIVSFEVPSRSPEKAVQEKKNWVLEDGPVPGLACVPGTRCQVTVLGFTLERSWEHAMAEFPWGTAGSGSGSGSGPCCGRCLIPDPGTSLHAGTAKKKEQVK